MSPFAPAARPFALLRDRALPALERRRAELEKMYSPVMGRPETNPEELRKASPAGLAARMDAAGADMRDVLARADTLCAAVNPHDPEAQWSTKKTLGKKGWHGYKAQVCESVRDAALVQEPKHSTPFFHAVGVTPVSRLKCMEKCWGEEKLKAIAIRVIVQPSVRSSSFAR